MATLVIDNFRGGSTYNAFGDINSGRSWIQVCSGQNPFLKPGQLTWNNAPVQIDPNGSVITDLILAGKERVENGVLYVYAIGSTGRLYKIQVNNPATYNPDYDNPVLLTTLTVNTPKFTRGAFMSFYGATEKIYISSDIGLTSVNFDGSGEAFVGVLGSWTQNVPKPLKQFVGKLYIGNGNNIAEVDTTATVTTYTKLSPGFPTNSQVRDMDVTPQGNYLSIVVSQIALPNILNTTANTTATASSESYIFSWNGVDTGYTSYVTYPTFSLSSNIMFGNYSYQFGTDQYGGAVYQDNQKIITDTENTPPLSNAVSSNGNLLQWIEPLYFGGVMEADFNSWGHLDFETGQPLGFWDLFFINAKAPETDIILAPFQIPISNTGLGSSSNNYANNIYGTSKIYFSTLETSSAPSTAYRLYKWTISTSNRIPSQDILIDAVYQTQTQMFSKKVSISEVRVYGEPWVAGNSFQIDLIGPDMNPITNGTYTFTAGGDLTIGNDYAWWGPDMAPTYAIGVSITNKGLVNHTINKIEIDYGPAGK